LTAAEVRKLRRTAAAAAGDSTENSQQEIGTTDPGTGPAALAS